jgi:hypothetical protein
MDFVRFEGADEGKLLFAEVAQTLLIAQRTLRAGRAAAVGRRDSRHGVKPRDLFGFDVSYLNDTV